MSSAADLKKLEEVLARFEVTIAEANDLVILQDYEIVAIADDSGSMRCPAAPSGFIDDIQTMPTRWDELRSTMTQIVEVATCFDESGMDIYFLNRPPLLGVKSAEDPRLAQSFDKPPAGGTPLNATLEQVAATVRGERPVLLFIFTDGEPSDGKDQFVYQVQSLVAGGGRGKVRVQIVACTSDDEEIGWLNRLDRASRAVDVTDDYFAERREVLRAGLSEKFTRGDWCMKAMLGPISHKFDAWDEKIHVSPPACGCTII